MKLLAGLTLTVLLGATSSVLAQSADLQKAYAQTPAQCSSPANWVMISPGKIIGPSFSCTIFREKCIEGLQIDEERSYQNLASSFAISTVFLQQLGYKRVSTLAKEALASNVSLADLAIGKGLITQSGVRKSQIAATMVTDSGSSR